MTQNRTTEDEVGLLSKLVTELHTRKANYMLKKAEEEPEALDLYINTRDVAAMGKWVLDNGMSMLVDSENEESELAQSLHKIKSKSSVLDFKRDAYDKGVG